MPGGGLGDGAAGITGAGVHGIDDVKLKLSDNERLDWLRLIRSENVGPRGIMAQTPPRGSDGSRNRKVT